MKNLIFILLFSFSVFAGKGIFIAPSLGFTYGSGGHDSLSSMLGNHVGVTGGQRIGNFAYELGIKRMNLTNESIGNEDYDSEITNDMYFGGVRAFLSDIFVLSAGLVSHNLSMEIKDDDGDRLKNKEDNGSFFGFYAGMGIQHELNNNMDLYWEGNLYPVPEISMFNVELTLGLRIFLN
jgi:hypothetical protein